MHEFNLRGSLDKKRTLKYLNTLSDIIVAKKKELDNRRRSVIIEKLKEVKAVKGTRSTEGIVYELDFIRGRLMVVAPRGYEFLSLRLEMRS